MRKRYTLSNIVPKRRYAEIHCRLLVSGFLLCLGVILAGKALPWEQSLLASTPQILPLALSPHTNPAGLAKGKFLVAGRQLNDPNFSESVVLMLGYGQQGALGVIVNRPTAVPLADVLSEAVQPKPQTGLVYLGGPVGRSSMLVLLRSDTQSEEAEHVFHDVYFSGSRSVLQKMIDTKDSIFRVYAGHAGWAPGQLDNEVARGDWHVISADVEHVFSTPAEKMWPELIERSAGKWVQLSDDIVESRTEGENT